MAESSNVVINSLVLWDEGVTAYDSNDLDTALQKFWGIPDPSAKVFFNIGMVHQALGNLDAAEKAFESSLTVDKHFAIGRYQLSIVHYNCRRFKDAEMSFKHTHESLRGKNYIDYKQLGLRFVLYECEILHNLALTCIALGERHKSFELINRAITTADKQTYKNRSQLVETKRLFQTGQKARLLDLPSDAIFRPPKSKTANIEKQDYLGKAKVISSVTENDKATGFIPVVKGKPPVPTTAWNSKMATPAEPLNTHVIVKIHFNYTCAIKVKQDTSLSNLQATVCKKFDRHPDELQLWYIMDKQLGLQQLCLESQIDGLWKLLKNKRLTLWCYEAKETSKPDVATKQVVALYDFTGQQEGDLSFKQGNIITDVREVDENWYEGQLHGNTGLIPKGYVEECALPPPPPPNNAEHSSLRSPSRPKSWHTSTEESPTSFGALMKELKTATNRRSVYLDDKS
ncbi:neutrophil cytosol factor 2-like [Saccoglossus kowalevskii]|uniref:Neutrophil cytosol factor 2-like n=1 Tax=Saccoglossus kowalevskii TaxID=10224 RepID=A0ABM0LZ35_SACKO|nr:PREDICTED: neutrophil cytosol factor 2-like [Saccoglossus kowalevskii]